MQRVADGNDLEAMEAAVAAAKADTRPSFIAVRTIIGYGSPKAGTNKAHGEPLGAADVTATKKFFGFPEDQSFYVPAEAQANWRTASPVARRAKPHGPRSSTATKLHSPSLPPSLTAPRRASVKQDGKQRFPNSAPRSRRPHAMPAAQFSTPSPKPSLS